jgi:hypothetical protein
MIRILVLLGRASFELMNNPFDALRPVTLEIYSPRMTETTRD